MRHADFEAGMELTGSGEPTQRVTGFKYQYLLTRASEIGCAHQAVMASAYNDCVVMLQRKAIVYMINQLSLGATQQQPCLYARKFRHYWRMGLIVGECYLQMTRVHF